MNKQALKVRNTYTNNEIHASRDFYYNEQYIRDSLSGSLFEKYLHTSDVGVDELSKFAISTNVTKQICEDLIPQIETLEDYFFVSKIVEQGYFKLISNLENLKIKNNLSISKEFGAFYTPIDIAREMAKDAVLGSKSKVIIDPCLGTGNLLAACMEFSAQRCIKINKLIGVEIDSLACNIARNSLEKLRSSLDISVEIEIINADSLDLLSQQMELFSQSIPSGTIIINPPYGKLKFESDKLNNEETKLEFNAEHSAKKQGNAVELKNRVKGVLGNLSTGRGNLEWSKVFLALCINHLDANEALVYIGPCGWLNSVSQNELRKSIIRDNQLTKIHFISESSTGFETVNQPLAIVNIAVNNKGDTIELINDFESSQPLKYEELKKLEHFGFPIPRVGLNDINLFIKLQRYRKVRNENAVTNLRGEVDQSLDKSIFTNSKSQLRIIRGENIGRFQELSVPQERTFYANMKEFDKKLSKKPKGIAYKQERIVCRQCSYMKQKRRLIFALIPKNCLVGNSCNYITVPDDLKLFYLGLFNSALMDWYFRVLNGNNHVANYEIDDFPIPEISESLKGELEKEVKIITSAHKSSNNPQGTTYNIREAKLDALIFTAFQLSVNEALIILKNTHSEEYIDTVLENLK